MKNRTVRFHLQYRRTGSSTGGQKRFRQLIARYSAANYSGKVQTATHDHTGHVATDTTPRNPPFILRSCKTQDKGLRISTAATYFCSWMSNFGACCTLENAKHTPLEHSETPPASIDYQNYATIDSFLPRKAKR